jgi:CRISPR-associated protein Csx17
LAHYLKALGILRLVAEQKDPAVRGWWQDEHFCLITSLDRDALELFFLDDYAPTPFVSPWNKGSGFFGENDKGLGPIEASSAPRFEKFRKGIEAARQQLAELTKADRTVRALKDRTKGKKGMTAAQKSAASQLKHDPEFKKQLAAAERAFKALKADLFGPALRTWRGAHRSWLDAAVVVVEDGRTVFPSLLGTGGNDGRLDFTNNAMQRVVELFDTTSGRPQEGAGELLRDALWSQATNKLSAGAAVGQFLPSGAGGANMTTGPDAGSRVNPWDFVVALEGAVCLSARATRRLDPRASRDASAPFAVQALGAGIATRGTERASRGEQWLPVWTRPTSFHDLLAMLGEARLQIGRRVAHRPIDVARAIARVGVAKGLDVFVRYGYLERNGQSNIAVALGRVDVRARPRARLIDDIAPWLDRLQRSAREDNQPARFRQAEGRLEDAVFAVLTHDESPDRWQAVLSAAADVESLQASGTGIAAGPMPSLSVDWVHAAEDGSVEWRLACALGSAGGAYDRKSMRPIDPVRGHCLPLEPGMRRFRTSEGRLSLDPAVVVTGRDLVSDCLALVERRLIESAERGQRLLPLVAAPGLEAHPSDLTELLAGSLDLQRVLDLSRALMAIRWEKWIPVPRVNAGLGKPEEAWVAIRLASLPWPLSEDCEIPVEGALVRRLRSGDGASALELALRRLRAAGLRPPIRGAVSSPDLARRWGAALAFPISRYQARRLARAFEPATQESR